MFALGSRQPQHTDSRFESSGTCHVTDDDGARESSRKRSHRPLPPDCPLSSPPRPLPLPPLPPSSHLAALTREGAWCVEQGEGGALGGSLEVARTCSWAASLRHVSCPLPDHPLQFWFPPSGSVFPSLEHDDRCRGPDSIDTDSDDHGTPDPESPRVGRGRAGSASRQLSLSSKVQVPSSPPPRSFWPRHVTPGGSKLLRLNHDHDAAPEPRRRISDANPTTACRIRAVTTAPRSAPSKLLAEI